MGSFGLVWMALGDLERATDCYEQALAITDEIGFPVLVRPSYVLGGRAMQIVHDRNHLARAMDELSGIGSLGKEGGLSAERPVLTITGAHCESCEVSLEVTNQVGLEAASLEMEIVGLVGGRGDHLIEKLFRDMKAMDIVEGTGQIQRIVMARQLVNLPRDG